VFDKDAASGLGKIFCDDILIRIKFKNKKVINIDIKNKKKVKKKLLNLVLSMK
jgi:hypothetical protein